MARLRTLLCVVPVLMALMPIQSASAASSSAPAIQTAAPSPTPQIANPAAGTINPPHTLGAAPAAPKAAAVAPPDYPPATWIPADPANYTVADRPHDYPLDMIVIHDTESTYADAIAMFQDPARQASAHYVVSNAGAITQMVLEKNVAWHAGNWDYNTRAIGIEHEGYAWTPGTFTTVQYQESAKLAASICSRWGVPMDRSHVIGHNEVPDPDNPGLFGGVDHHTDPGPYWDWTTYMSLAKSYANALTSPPHLVLTPYVTPTDGGATISWDARTCRTPVASYRVVVQPGNIVLNFPGTTTSTTFTGLLNGTSYSFTVTATNPDGQDTQTTTFIPSPPCTNPTMTATPASPGATGSPVNFSAATASCTNPTYKFWTQAPGARWQIVRDYSNTSTFTWTGSGLPGLFNTEVDVRQQTSSVVYDKVFNLPYQINPCTGATLTANQWSPQPPGTAIVLTGAARCPGPPEYRFWTRAPGGSWGIVQDYSPTATLNWNTTGMPLGSYGLEVDVRDHGATDVYETVAILTFVLGPAECHNPTLTANPASSAATGSPVSFTAGSVGCPNPRYRFWIAPPNQPWSIVQDYGPTNTFNWASTGAAGTYGVEVDVRDQLSTNSYDAVSNLTYALRGCTAAHLATDKPSPQLPGPAIVLTASASCPGTPEYRFWTSAPGGSWTIVRDYSPTATFSWNTTGMPLGTYGLEVDVRNHGATEPYETVANFTFVLAPAECGNPTLTANPASSVATGSPVSFTAGSTGCPNPRYRFWIAPPNQPWAVIQDYSPANTFTWTSTGVAGSYRVEVDVRDQLSSNSYDAVSNVSYAVVGCTAAHLTTDKTSPQLPGAAIVLTGSGSCPGTPEYRFWLRAPDGSWSMVRDYSPAATFSWNTAGKPNGAYALEVDIRDHGATDVYESVANLSFTLALCTSATLTANPANTAPHGSAITLNANSTCATTATYKFWIKAQDGAWTVVQPYGPSKTYSWTPATAGIYSLEVDVLDLSSPEAYDVVVNITYQVT